MNSYLYDFYVAVALFYTRLDVIFATSINLL